MRWKRRAAKQDMEWLQGGDLAGVYGRKLRFKDGFLYIFVSEYALDTTIQVKDTDTSKTMHLH